MYWALNKYPSEIWHIEILAFGFRSEQSLNAAEIFYIAKFKSKEKGYNCTEGGEGVSGLRFKHTEEAKRKISEGNRGKVVPFDSRRKIAEAQRHRSPEWTAKIVKSLTGHKVSQETRDKISRSLVGYFRRVR